MGERPSEAIELPDHQGVPRSHKVEGLIKPWAIGPSPAGGVREDPFTAGLLQRILLQRDGLIQGRNASIANKHRPIVSQLISQVDE